MDDADADLALAIPAKAIIDECVCPICFALITDCTITPCGHNFCSRCILECLNRRHKCPVCNSDVVREKVVKNFHLDQLLCIVNAEKEKASVAYFERLIANASQPHLPAKDHQAGKEANASVGFCRNILSPHEDYYKEVRASVEQCKRVVINDIATRMESHRTALSVLIDRMRCRACLEPGTDGVALKCQLEEMLRSLSEQSEKCALELTKMFDDSLNQVMDGYLRYMSAVLPPPANLTITVSVSVPAAAVKWDSVAVKLTDTAKDIKESIKERLGKAGRPITAFSPQNILAVVTPSEGPSTVSGASTLILDDNRPIIQYRVRPGAQLLLKGPVFFLSEMPKQCFATTFSKEVNAPMDYYTCQDCKFNYHRVIEYIKRHVSTWGCCYCKKNGKCTLKV